MNNLEEKYKLSCHVKVINDYCKELDENQKEHGEFTQHVFKKKTRPYSWTNEEFLNWQYPKTGDPLCPKCRRKFQDERNEIARQDSLKVWFDSLSESQQLHVLEERRQSKEMKDKEEQIRRQKGFVTKGDFKAMQLGDHND